MSRPQPTASGRRFRCASNPARMCAKKFSVSPRIVAGACANFHSAAPHSRTSSSRSRGLTSMRKFFTLLGREVRSYFYSPVAYIVLLFFLLLSGVDFYFQLSFMNGRQVPYTVQEAFFNSVFFWFAFVLIFPLITMRLFSEEFKLGTIEPLMTAPVRDWEVVLAKFCGAGVFYLVLWTPTILYFLIFQFITKQPAPGSIGAYLGSYLMLFLLG